MLWDFKIESMLIFCKNNNNIWYKHINYVILAKYDMIELIMLATKMTLGLS